MTQFHRSNFTLRPYREDDAEALARAADNPNIRRNLGHGFPSPYTVEAAHAWIRECQTVADGSLRLTIDIAGTASGGIGLYPVAKWSPYTFEIGYWLAEPHWGRGIVTGAVALLTQFAFDRRDALRVQAHVYDWNPASSRVLEKNSFTLEGRLRCAVHMDGRTGDCLAYGRLR
jgi:[ribosomal protein S5]-alanine N-acetyltransferase